MPRTEKVEGERRSWTPEEREREDRTTSKKGGGCPLCPFSESSRWEIDKRGRVRKKRYGRNRRKGVSFYSTSGKKKPLLSPFFRDSENPVLLRGGGGEEGNHGVISSLKEENITYDDYQKGSPLKNSAHFKKRREEVEKQRGRKEVGGSLERTEVGSTSSSATLLSALFSIEKEERGSKA